MINTIHKQFESQHPEGFNPMPFQWTGIESGVRMRSIIFGKKDVSERATGATDYTLEKSQEVLLRELMQNIDKLKIK